MLETAKIGRTTESAFKEKKEVEEFTVVSEQIVELVYINRMSFCECLMGGGKPDFDDDLTFFVSQQNYFPTDYDFRKKYYENFDWGHITKKLGKYYDGMTTTPVPAPLYQKKSIRITTGSPTKGFSRY